jgi:hypothetical protein
MLPMVMVVQLQPTIQPTGKAVWLVGCAQAELQLSTTTIRDTLDPVTNRWPAQTGKDDERSREGGRGDGSNQPTSTAVFV